MDAAGNLYVADSGNHVVRRITPNGIISPVAGNGTAGFAGDGGPALAAQLRTPVGVAIDTNDDLYIADRDNHRIRKISADGTIATVAGNGISDFGGDNGPALAASLKGPQGITLDAQGNLYIADTFNNRIRKVAVDGMISTVAGNGYLSDLVPATAPEAWLAWPKDIAVDSQGSLFIADWGNNRIRKVSVSGIITTLANKFAPFGTAGGGDGRAAIRTTIKEPEAIAADRNGNVYFTDNSENTLRIRLVNRAGIINTVAGSKTFPYEVPNEARELATAKSLGTLHGLSINSIGHLYITKTWFNRVTQGLANRIRKVTPFLPEADFNDIVLASSDGSQLFYFNAVGRHQRTVNSRTGATVYTFTYDATGHLTQITDGDGNVTRITRDGNGQPTAIVSPDGLTTTLTVDTNDYLAGIANPAGDTYRMTYTPTGLLTEFKDPRGNASVMTYDALGRLTKDQDAAVGSTTLSRAKLSNGYEIMVKSASNRTMVDRVENLPDGSQRFTDFLRDGTKGI